MEVLKWIREEPAVRTLPVIVLSSSLQDSDIHRAYIVGANAYLTKPSQPEELIVMAKAIQDFWLNQNCIAQKSPDLFDETTRLR